MPRVKINEPSIYVFSTRIQVRVSDLNYGNHLGNERVLAFAQEARLHFFAQYGMSELDFWGTSLIQGDAALTYANEGFLHDMIQVEIGVDDISNSSYDLIYKMTNETTGKPLAMVKTRMVCFDYSDRKVQNVPSDFISLFK